MKGALCVVLAMNFCLLRAAFPTESTMHRSAESLLASRGQTGGASWVDSDSVAVLNEIRNVAKSEIRAVRLQALTTLANLGDTNAIVELARELDQARLRETVRIRREMERHSTQPAIIPHLLPSLELEEDSNLQFVDYEFFVEPRSVASARIIRSIVVQSGQFPDSTKEWAMHIDESNVELLRAEIRLWCRENREHLLAHEFEKALPPTWVEEGSVSDPET